MTRIAILGAGAWGSALGATLSEAGHVVTFWRRGEGFDLLGEAEIALVSVPAGATREVLSAAAPPPGLPLVLTAKGVEPGTLALQTEIAADAAPGRPAAVLSGPGFAGDLTRGLPTAVTLACADAALGARLQAALATPSLRPYLSDDPVGVQLGGALKNVIAIGCGAAMGAGLGESARAAPVSRGFAEMTRLATALGARAETLAGLSGLGDLVLTATSAQSRNYAFGLAVGQGTDPAALAADGRTYEGARTAGAAVALAERAGVEMPIARTVAGLVAGRLTVPEAVATLFNRPLRRE